MAKKLYMHIGMPKTGTTSIQAFFGINRGKLKERGFLFPETLNGWVQHSELWPISTHSKFVNYTDCIPFKHYKEQIKNSGCDTVLVSSECFCIGTTMDDYKEFTSEFDTAYIAYVRSPLPYAQTLMLQNVIQYYNKYNMDQELYLLPTNQLVNYITCQINWISNFFYGTHLSDNVIIKSYDLERKNDTLIENFCSIVGIHNLYNLEKPARENLSLPYLDAYYFLAHLAMLPLSLCTMLSIEDELRAMSFPDGLPVSRFRIFSRWQIENIATDISKAYEDLGNRIGDPDLWKRGREEMINMEECPWRQLPADRQWAIFEKLSPENQAAILKVWPTTTRTVAGGLRGSAFLPAIRKMRQTRG